MAKTRWLSSENTDGIDVLILGCHTLTFLISPKRLCSINVLKLLFSSRVGEGGGRHPSSLIYLSKKI